MADIKTRPKGIALRTGTEKTIRDSKRLRPVAALDAWLAELAARGVTDGPRFRSMHGSAILPQRLCDKSVARVVKKRVAGKFPTIFGRCRRVKTSI